jgi:LCP family protein required for cell wall assembly
MVDDAIQLSQLEQLKHQFHCITVTVPAVNRSIAHRFKRILLLLCCITLLPIVNGCGALNRIDPPTATQTVTASITPTSTITPTLNPAPTSTATPPHVICGETPAMFILLIGSDGRGRGYSVGLADSIRVVRVDFVEPRIQILAFQRDLYVEIPEIEDHNKITHGKLTQAYLYGNPGYAYYDGEGQGPGLMALTLQHNFGVQVDHYIALNLQTFVKVVDELGGIDIDLPDTIDGRVKRSRDPNRYFPAGKQHLNGYRTMLLARLRPQGDFRRVEVQNLILQAFAEKMLGRSILEFPELIKKFGDAVQTDLGPVEIGQLLCLRSRLSKQAVEYLNFPESLFKSDRVHDPVLGNTSIQAADFDILKIFVRRFNEGRWHLPSEHMTGEMDP